MLNRKGFAPIIIIVAIIVLLGLSYGIYYFFNQFKTIINKPGVTNLSQSSKTHFSPSQQSNTTPRNTPATPINSNPPKNNTPPASPKINFSNQSIDYFLEIAIGAEYGANEQKINKWEQPVVKIKQNGNITSLSTQCLSSVITDFNQLSNQTKLELSDSNQDIDVYFVPANEFTSIEPNYASGNQGFFWTRWTPEGKIYTARVLINSTNEVTDSERCHLIREELTQGMGLRNDSEKYPDSIFYQEWTSVNSYSAIDQDVIRMLYSTNIQAGDNPTTVRYKLSSPI